jgi:4-amino-4-deoxy-L-arabinose transferase-like glycosyltransferase
MPAIYRVGLIVLGCALTVRLAAMAIFPLTDTTEARYGEIARLMLETRDWITPYFDYGVPFWGKPPLAIWLQAGAFRLLGVNEFAGRLPSLLAIMACMACVYRYPCPAWTRRAGVWTLIVFFTSALAYIAAGAIQVDAFLALGTTLSMVSLADSLRTPRSGWCYLFFVGLAIGLLTKGPIAMVLVAGPVCIWATITWQWPAVWRVVPWGRGTLLTAALALPWYGLAELKTPGFLYYFLIGEHWLRYTQPGWTGDLYGSAHKHPFGTIWLLWLGAAFPWGLVALWKLLPSLWTGDRLRALAGVARESDTAYLLAWAVFPMIFFTFAGNVLWTYVLPGLPAFAVLLGVTLAQAGETRRTPWPPMAHLAWIAPVVLAAVVAVVQVEPSLINTEKYLVQFYNENRRESSTLTYIGDRPFSARFYSRGKARLLPVEKTPTYAATPTSADFIAISRSRRPTHGGVSVAPPGTRFSSRRFDLIELTLRQDPTAAGDTAAKQP